MAVKHKNFNQVKRTYLDHATDPDVMRKLSPAHIIGIKKVEIEERKLQLGQDALRMAVMGKLLGGSIIDGEEVNEPEKLTEGLTGKVREK